MVLHKHHLLQRFAALEGSKHVLKKRAQGLGLDGSWPQNVVYPTTNRSRQGANSMRVEITETARRGQQADGKSAPVQEADAEFATLLQLIRALRQARAMDTDSLVLGLRLAWVAMPGRSTVL